MAGEFDELMQLATDLGDAPSKVAPFVRTAIQRTSGLVKKDAQASVRGRDGFGHAANAITYETHERSDGVTSDIGYEKGKGAGSLGNLIEFGAPGAKKHMLRNGRNVPVPGAVSLPLAPTHDLGNALLNNEDDFVRGIEAAVDDAMREVGL